MSVCVYVHSVLTDPSPTACRVSNPHARSQSRLRAENEAYLERHPEVKRIMAYYTSQVGLLVVLCVDFLTMDKGHQPKLNHRS